MADAGVVPPPSALAIGICDLVYRDISTGKRFIMGCFSALHAYDFPAIHPSLGIYLDLTNGRGQVKVRVQIIDADELREPIWQAEQEIDFQDPRMVMESDFMLVNLSFPEPGEYRVQVYGNDHPIIERRIVVNKLERNP